MARPNRPSYRPDRRVWFFDLSGRRRYICKGVPRDERPQRDGIPRRVWDAMDEIIRAEGTVAVPPKVLTVYWLAETYLAWIESEVEGGRLEAVRLVSARIHINYLMGYSGLREVPAEKVEVDRVDDFFARLRSVVSQRTGRPLQPYYVHEIGKTVRHMFRWAARPVAGRKPVRLLAANPVDGYQFPKQPGAVRGYVEGAVVRRFLRWAWARSRWVAVPREPDPATGRPPLKPAVGIVLKSTGKEVQNLKRRFDRIYVLMLRFERLTGCRPGEACGLVWSEVSPPPPTPAADGAPAPRWEPRMITVHPKRVKTRRQTDRARKIHVTEPVARLLRALHRLPGRHPEYVFTHMRGTRSADRGHVDPVAGEPWPSGSAASKKLTEWRGEAVAAGLEGLVDVGPTRLIAYANRHALASEVSSLGFTDEQIAEQLGNTPEVLRRIYAHSVEDVAAENARLMAERRREINRKRRDQGPSAG